MRSSKWLQFSEVPGFYETHKVGHDTGCVSLCARQWDIAAQRPRRFQTFHPPSNIALAAERFRGTIPLREIRGVGFSTHRQVEGLGWVAEWSIAHAWKACLPQGNGGSNPPPSAPLIVRGLRPGRRKVKTSPADFAFSTSLPLAADSALTVRVLKLLFMLYGSPQIARRLLVFPAPFVGFAHGAGGTLLRLVTAFGEIGFHGRRLCSEVRAVRLSAARRLTRPAAFASARVP